MSEQLALEFGDGPDDEPASPAVPAGTAPAGTAETEQEAEEIEEWGQLGLAAVPAGRTRTAIPSTVWERLLAHERTRASYQAKIWQPTGGGCAWWLGAISDTGHGKLRVSRRLRTSVQVVTAHVYGWQLHHGIIAPRPGEDLVIAHTCDEASCQQPAHWELVPRGWNGADYLARRHGGPLADERGPQGRASAIRNAILTAQAAGADPDQIAQAITAAQAAGIARTQGLF